MSIYISDRQKITFPSDLFAVSFMFLQHLAKNVVKEQNHMHFIQLCIGLSTKNFAWQMSLCFLL